MFVSIISCNKFHVHNMDQLSLFYNMLLYFLINFICALAFNFYKLPTITISITIKTVTTITKTLTKNSKN